MSSVANPAPLAIIAEDEDLGRLLLCESVTAAGLTPLAFDNGLDALDAALSKNVSIILLDVDMPGLDGYSVCRRIRESGKFDAVPIVMVTGRDDMAAINQAFDAGATDYISKPVNWDLLPHRLAYVLRNAASVRALADREAKVRALVEALPDALWVVSPGGELRWTPNGGAPGAMPYGTAAASLRLDLSLPPERVVEVLTAIRDTASDGAPRKLEYRDDGAGTGPRSAELRFSVCDGGDVLVVRRDTSERTAAAAHIERLAYFDPLTDLPNRQRCIDVAERLLIEAKKSGEGVGFVYLDLNSFKRVNDTFGHSVGDLVLKNVAGALARALEPFTAHNAFISLARLSGDEFVISVKDAPARQTALRIADACCAALNAPITCNQLEFFATPSIGVAVYPDDGDTVETLLKHADTAMYHSKSSGVQSISMYTPAMSARMRDRLELESRLRRAVREDLLSMHFQPKFRLHDNSLAGVEALVRWCDAEHGEIAPSRFVPIAEETGLIVDMGIWIVRAVCRQLRLWMDRGIAVPVAVNLSGKELSYGDPARDIEALLSEFGIPPSLFEVEITESVFVTDSSAANGSVERLRNLGCRIALDDFGTGYSSLAYLTRFPPDRLKIDRSFVQNLDRSESDAAIVNAIMSLAQSLNLVVTAEGVERQTQLEWLRNRGCHEAQGYLLARPMTAGDLESRFLHAPSIESIGERRHIAGNAL
jgi:diguanylate cyclase (GGDEF)-like protein